MATTALSFRYTANLYFSETKYEILKQSRNRMYAFATLAFPLMFYGLFGLTNKFASVNGVTFAKYLMASYCVFGMLAAALFGVGVNLAVERGQGWLEVKQASPMPPLAMLMAKTLSSACFALTVSCLLMLLGRFAGGVHMTAFEVVKLLGVIAAGAIPFGAMGLVFGLIAPSTAAPGLINLFYLPMSFCSGLWVPLQVLPEWVSKIAIWLPAYHLAQLAFRAVGFTMDDIRTSTHWEALAAFTIFFLTLGWVAYRRANMKA
jgi:ABC-2 type transport system permease protein